jgi:hypothetical protein
VGVVVVVLVVLGVVWWGVVGGGWVVVGLSAKQAPWRISMDYLKDRKEMRHAPIDDGHLRFEKTKISAQEHA